MAPAAEEADAPAAASPPEVRLPESRLTKTDEHRRYSPVVVRIAAEHGLDIAQIPGTGIGGRVSKRDVEKYLASLRGGGAAVPAQPAQPQPSHVNGSTAPVAPTTAKAPAPTLPPTPTTTGGGYHPPVYQPREGDVVEAFTRRRKLIAEHMVYSKTHSPHVGTLAEVDLTKLVRLREAHKKSFQEREGFALTMLPLASAATVRALKEFPRMNASVVGDSLVIRRQINLGIAMDSDEGLLVPVIKAAETMSVVGLAREIERLRRKVQEKKITADDLSSGSFTLSNPGREGNLYGFAIINQPQVGILRMGEVKKRPVVIEVDGADALAIRTMMYLALSYDHRVVDGVLGNSFLYRTARIMEEADFEL
jgi:2-oxoglutarate dehydrogenase E2 component (dihydrolipoamide succinyltransferase)